MSQSKEEKPKSGKKRKSVAEEDSQSSKVKKSKSNTKRNEVANEQTGERTPMEEKPVLEERENSEKIMKPNKGKKMKKRKKKEEEQVQQESKAKEHAIEYLRLWKDNREEWSFKKVRQVWLMGHMWDAEQVRSRTSDGFFDVFIENVIF
jgi:hypothetical protein